ncbi:MAG: chaperonin GroEL [Planctomycetota bacterium]
MPKQITFDKEAQEGFMEGVDKFARAVKSTLGPRGRYAVIERGFGAPQLTKDGASVAEDVELADPVQNVAGSLLRSVADKTASSAGDGSTTATVLAEAIFRRGIRNVVAGANPILVQRGLQAATRRVLAHLEDLTVPIHGNAKIANVAALAANNNKEIGKLIADAMAKVGEDGVISIEEGKGVDTKVEVVEGMEFDRGYLSQYFVTDDVTARVELDNPYILIMEEKISNLAQILPVLEKVAGSKRPLFIIAEDIEGEALSTLVVNQQRGVLRCAACKAPGYGDRRKAMLEDIAIATGGTAIMKDLGREPGTISLKDLGQAKRVAMTSDATTISRGAGKKARIKDRVRQLQQQLETTESKYDTEKLQERIARLVGGIAEIQVGGATDVEVKEKKKRFENALSATRHAVTDGILPGGGVAFLRCVAALEEDRVKSADERVGVEILRDALEAPFRQLAKNAGMEPSRLLRKVYYTEDINRGYDFEKKKECNLLDAGIVDSYRVMKLALENAVSVAALMFTTDAVITDIPTEDDEHEGHHEGESMGGF